MARGRGASADRPFPSSKSCSGRGVVRNDLDLSTRTFSCETYHLIIDRDLNAAINLARWQPEDTPAAAPPVHTSTPLLSTA